MVNILPIKREIIRTYTLCLLLKKKYLLYSLYSMKKKTIFYFKLNYKRKNKINLLDRKLCKKKNITKM